MESHASVAAYAPALAEADYEHVQRLIYHTVHKFRKRYRLWDRPEGSREWDLEFMISMAHEEFARARHTYDPSRGAKFSSWVRTLIWRGLSSRLIRFGRRAARQEIRDFDLQSDPDNEAPLAALMWEEISDDARAVIELALEPAIDIRMELKNKDTPCARRRAIRDYCRDAFGWGAERIASTFDEIATLLQG